MEITIPEPVLDVLERLATAAEGMLEHAKTTQELFREDLAFRREMAHASEAEKQLFLQMMFGGKIPGANEAAPGSAPPAPSGPGGDADPPMRRRRHPNA